MEGPKFINTLTVFLLHSPSNRLITPMGCTLKQQQVDRCHLKKNKFRNANILFFLNIFYQFERTYNMDVSSLTLTKTKQKPDICFPNPTTQRTPFNYMFILITIGKDKNGLLFNRHLYLHYLNGASFSILYCIQNIEFHI